MNERIRELAIEAGFYANPDVEKFEKLAELIVGECVEVVTWAISMHCTIEEVPALIKEHFGIPSTL